MCRLLCFSSRAEQFDSTFEGHPHALRAVVYPQCRVYAPTIAIVKKHQNTQ